MIRKKRLGAVYTPNHIVDIMLDSIGYKGKDILNKHIMDNSAGEGAFLMAIVKRYIRQAQKENLDNETIKINLETYIHGIEIDDYTYDELIDNLNVITEDNGIFNVDWDIDNKNALTVSRFDMSMDYVVGNPPYIRVANLDQDMRDILKQYDFSNRGNVDVLLAFYELGIRMLNKTGKLIYITPDSILKNKSSNFFKKVIINNDMLSAIIDFKGLTIFKGVSTTPAIIKLSRRPNKGVLSYYIYNDDTLSIEYVDDITYKDAYINNNIYLGDKKALTMLSTIKDIDVKEYNIDIKYALTTLANDVFISKDFDPNNKDVIVAYKASTGEKTYMIYPYHKDGTPKSFDALDKQTRDYLNKHKTRLFNRSITDDKDWYLYGRYQGINDMKYERYALSTILKDKDDVNPILLKPYEGVFSGMYIVGDITYDEVLTYLKSDTFIEYIRMVGLYKNGGYVSIKASDILSFLIYKKHVEIKNK